MQKFSDEQIIKLVAEGDIDMFKEIVAKYSAIIYRVCYRILGNEHDASDMTQDVFLKALKSSKQFKGNASVPTWLHTIAVNSSINFVKRRNLVKFFSLSSKIEGDENSIIREPVSNIDNIELSMVQVEQSKIIQVQLMKLKPDLRAVLVLKYIEDKSYEEIAEICKCSKGTVGSRISRAVEQLTENLKEYAGE